MVPPTEDALVVRGAGISVEPPRGWLARTTRRTVRLRSPDRTTIVVVSAPPHARRAARLLRTALSVLRQRYEDVRVGGTGGRRLGGRPTMSRVVRARNARGINLRMIAAAAQGRRRAWLVEVFSAEGAPPHRLLEGQAALRSLRLSG